MRNSHALLGDSAGQSHYSRHSGAPAERLHQLQEGTDSHRYLSRSKPIFEMRSCAGARMGAKSARTSTPACHESENSARCGTARCDRVRTAVDAFNVGRAACSPISRRGSPRKGTVASLPADWVAPMRAGQASSNSLSRAGPQWQSGAYAHAAFSDT